jgi:predicted acylesterase/phospholipase RssA
MTKFLWCLICFGFLTGCASYAKNPPLENLNTPADYRFDTIYQQNPLEEETFVVLSFSGGGTRAAALAYGVVDHLSKVKVNGGEETLLDKVNVISGISGGSFAAAYYGLYGKEKFLKDFKDDVLYRRISSQLLRRTFLPWNLWKIGSPWFGRSDLAAEYLDKKIFKGKTFREMPRRWPFIVISGADMSRGTPFSFTQEEFDKICSDLNGVKIARAVMTSAAFPGPFTPLTYKNYPKSRCGYETPEWVEAALAKDSDQDPEEWNWAQNWKSYEDAKARPYLHLYDGGIADNLGLRPAIFALVTGTWRLIDRDNPTRNVKRFVVIVVDAKPEQRKKFDKTSKPPKLASIIGAAASKPISNYTVDTMVKLHDRFAEFDKANKNYKGVTQLCDELVKGEKERKACYDRFVAPGRGIQPPLPEFYLIHVRFSKAQSEHLFNQLAYIATDLQLPRKEVDLVVQNAGELLERSSEYQRLLKDLGAEPLG